MSDLMWAELHFLKSVKPFSEEALTAHIYENPEEWNQIFEKKQLEFKDIPSNKLLDTLNLHDGTKMQEPVTKPTTGRSREEKEGTAKRIETNASKKLSRDSGAPDA